MSSYNKGKRSREEIISSSRRIFNEYGIQITLARLAELMDTTLGRLTHHFRNKDLLFIAIALDYEEKLAELRSKRTSNQVSLDSLINAASTVMDLQYDYRCAMRYIVSSLKGIDEMKTHISQTYANSRLNIRALIEAHVQAGSLKSQILTEDTYDVFLFQFTNLFTNWVINLELYDNGKEYASLKPIYLKGIISVFLPFLTEKGKIEVETNGLFKN
jgi:AcrR family transcriptional regulator